MVSTQKKSCTNTYQRNRWQVGGSGPAAYLPENLAVQCLLRGGDNPDELALDLSPRPFMLVTPVGGERNSQVRPPSPSSPSRIFFFLKSYSTLIRGEHMQNAATFVGLLRHLTESKQLAKLPIRTSHITVTRQDKLDPSAHARVHEERTYEESSKERQDESAVSVFKETRETLVLYPPACWALKSCVLSTAPVQVSLALSLSLSLSRPLSRSLSLSRPLSHFISLFLSLSRSFSLARALSLYVSSSHYLHPPTFWPECDVLCVCLSLSLSLSFALSLSLSLAGDEGGLFGCVLCTV